MIKRSISPQTRIKVIKTAIDILNMHGQVAGDRVCQDWSGEGSRNPEKLFTSQERDDLEYNHQITNSQLEDYEQGSDFFGDEMSVSFAMADALDDLVEELEEMVKEQ